MIAVYTNILVYAHRRDSEWHERAVRATAELAGWRAPWGVPWPCLHEFLAIVTHPRIYALRRRSKEPWIRSKSGQESPSLRVLGELAGHWKELKEIVSGGRIVGGAVHDARVVAICREHGVREIWSADRDFSRIMGLRVRNPLLA